MAFNLYSSIPTSASFATPISLCNQRSQILVTKSELNDSSSADTNLGPKKVSKLEIGSPIIVTEAPNLLKTAASVPCLRVNAGLVKPGDVGRNDEAMSKLIGRIVSRKPKDVWAVRLNIGTYLIDGKYFKPLELDD